ncbi:hypothetical protein BZG36_01014 [Bifiguratus adelaidae]|uniref:Chorismate mutase n=1 Tax=Bifiguratus adelaidae TaxID=1938954 RepID=A0A261Y684_9FUNG|nr:hypothetical protein BZG36_01014 [Bifiguratus adelaidae]
MNFLTQGENPFSLDNIRRTLVRLEDTIIFALIERAQFAQNNDLYNKDAAPFKDVTNGRTFLEHFLWETEQVHAKARRYTSPDEYAFTSPLPDPILPSLSFPKFLAPNDINVNAQIMDLYLQHIVPKICAEGDDLNYGSAATRDIECLQALSRRIHYGKFVAETKFRSNPKEYSRLAHEHDRDGIDKLLTNSAVEAALLQRLHRKALIYGQTVEGPTADEHQTTQLKIPVEVVVDLYKTWVIPLTKLVEVDYLEKRGLEWDGNVDW